MNDNRLATPIRVAAVGTGYFSRFQYAAWRRIAEVELVGVCSLSEAEAKTVASECGTAAAFTDVVCMLEETSPDLLDIITPPVTHLDIITIGARYGVNMICQKPFCTNLEQAIQAVEVAETAGVRLLVHENFRFQPWYDSVREVLASGRLGDLYEAVFRLRPGDGRGPEAYLNRQPYFRTMPRFLIHETAIHLIDVFRFLFGDVAKIYADLHRLNSVIEGEDTGIVIFEFKSGMRAMFDGNRLSDHVAENRRLTMGELLIEGSKGSLFLDGNASLRFRETGSNEVELIPYSWQNVGVGGDSVFRFQKHVVDQILARKSSVTESRHYLENLRVEKAVYESNLRARRIEL